MDARFKLLEIASFLDRVDRHEGDADFRHPAFATALAAMQTHQKARHVRKQFISPSQIILPSPPNLQEFNSRMVHIMRG